MDLYQEALQDEEVAAVRLECVLPSGIEFEVTGSAKKHPKDRHDADIGFALAQARACRMMADRLESWALLDVASNEGSMLRDLAPLVGLAIQSRRL